MQKRAMMKAARIHEFGPPSVIVIEELLRPTWARRSPSTSIGPFRYWSNYACKLLILKA